MPALLHHGASPVPMIRGYIPESTQSSSQATDQSQEKTEFWCRSHLGLILIVVFGCVVGLLLISVTVGFFLRHCKPKSHAADTGDNIELEARREDHTMPPVRSPSEQKTESLASLVVDPSKAHPEEFPTHLPSPVTPEFMERPRNRRSLVPRVSSLLRELSIPGRSSEEQSAQQDQREQSDHAPLSPSGI
jgi:hypothetical protein